MDLRAVGCDPGDWINLAYEMNFRVLQKPFNYLTIHTICINFAVHFSPLYLAQYIFKFLQIVFFLNLYIRFVFFVI